MLTTVELFTFSNSVFKILESVFMDRITSTNDNYCYQFGYKSGHSTGRLCIKILNSVIDYYTGHNSYSC